MQWPLAVGTPSTAGGTVSRCRGRRSGESRSPAWSTMRPGLGEDPVGRITQAAHSPRSAETPRVCEHVRVIGRVLSKSDLVVLTIGVLAVAAAGVMHYAGVPAVLAFVVAGAAVALLASLVGRSVEQLGDRFGAGATSVLQS